VKERYPLDRENRQRTGTVIEGAQSTMLRSRCPPNSKINIFIGAYRLHTIKKRGIGDTVLYLVIAPKDEAVVRGLTILGEGIHLSGREILGH